jgi:uncharacterized membrane protein SirB2
MNYVWLKYLHVGSVAVSYTLFFLRGIWVLRASAMMQRRWVKIAPHAVDTVLLSSAIALAYLLEASPINAPWLLAKIIALLLYIGLGFVAIKYGKTQRQRLVAWLAAQMVFFYIVAVALTKAVLPWSVL